MDEIINLDLMISKKEAINVLNKKINSINKRIEKYDENSEEDDETTSLKIKKLTVERIVNKKELKALNNDYEKLLKEAVEVYFEDIDYKKASFLAYENYDLLITRAERRFNKLTYYYSGIDYDYDKSKTYYLIIAYCVNKFIAKNKYINRFIKISDDFKKQMDVLCDMYEYYFKTHNLSRFIGYAKRVILK